MDVLSKLNAKAGLIINKDLQFINKDGRAAFSIDNYGDITNCAAANHIYTSEFLMAASNTAQLNTDTYLNTSKYSSSIVSGSEIIIQDITSGFKLKTSFSEDGDFPGSTITAGALEIKANGQTTSNILNLITTPYNMPPEQAALFTSQINIEPLSISIDAGGNTAGTLGSYLDMYSDDIGVLARNSYNLRVGRGEGKGSLCIYAKNTDITSNTLKFTTKTDNNDGSFNSSLSIGKTKTTLITTEFFVTGLESFRLNSHKFELTGDHNSTVFINFANADTDSTEFIEMSASGIAISNSTSNGRRSMVTSNVKNFKIDKLTQSQYDSLETKDPNTLYIIV